VVVKQHNHLLVEIYTQHIFKLALRIFMIFILIVPPRIQPGRRLITGFLGDARTEVTCVVSGIPEPETTWFRDGQRLRPDGQKLMVEPTGSLIITNLQVMWSSCALLLQISNKCSY